MVGRVGETLGDRRRSCRNGDHVIWVETGRDSGRDGAAVKMLQRAQQGLLGCRGDSAVR